MQETILKIGRQYRSHPVYAIFVRRKSMYLRTCGSFTSANHKRLGPQTANSRTSTFAEGSQILSNYFVRKFADF
jgi:hypothetical protein